MEARHAVMKRSPSPCAWGWPCCSYFPPGPGRQEAECGAAQEPSARSRRAVVWEICGLRGGGRRGENQLSSRGEGRRPSMPQLLWFGRVLFSFFHGWKGRRRHSVYCRVLLGSDTPFLTFSDGQGSPLALAIPTNARPRSSPWSEFIGIHGRLSFVGKLLGS